MAQDGSPDGVTVVIPHYGDPSLAQHVVESLGRSNTPRTLQVVVSDDASPQPFPDQVGVEVVRSLVNGGFGAAVNRGARLAREPWLLILNSDVDFDVDFVERFLTEAELRKPGVFGPSIVWGETTLPSARTFPKPLHPFCERVFALDRWRETKVMRRLRGYDLSCRDGRATPVDWVSGAAMLLRTDNFRRVVGFDEDFFLYSEEVDLQRRLRDMGVGAVHLGQVSLRHYGGASTDQSQVRYRAMVSDLRYARKRRRAGLQAFGYIAAIGVNAVHDVVRRVRGDAIAPRQRMQSAVVEFGTAWEESRCPSRP